MAKLFANSGDPDQTPRSVVSDLGLHDLPITLLRVSRLQWVKEEYSVIILRFSPVLVKTYKYCGYSLEVPCCGTSNALPMRF